MTQQPLFERAQMIALANRQRVLNKEADRKVVKTVVREVVKEAKK